MRKDINKEAIIFPMPVLIIATYNEDSSVDVMNATCYTAYDSFNNDYYEVSNKVDHAFSDGKKLM